MPLPPWGTVPPHPSHPCVACEKTLFFVLLSTLVLRPPWQHDEMCLLRLFSFKKCNKYLFCISLKVNRWFIELFCKRSILILSTLDFQYMCRCQHMFLIPCQFCSHSKKNPMLDKYSLSQIGAFCFSREKTLYQGQTWFRFVRNRAWPEMRSGGRVGSH